MTPEQNRQVPETVALYGAVRSGTTLLRIMLGGHPELHNPGETDFLLDHIAPDPSHPTGWRYDLAALRADRAFRYQGLALPEGLDGRDLLDAMVGALDRQQGGRLVLVFHRNAKKLANLLSGVAVIHLLRDPRDVARSVVGMGWAGNSYVGIGHWLRAEEDWSEAAIDPGTVCTVTFEDLVADEEAELTRICGFLRLPFLPELLNYPSHSTYSPANPGLAFQWLRKAGHREVARLDALAGPLLVARGYAPSGPAEVTPGAIERAFLILDHRLKRAAASIRRYGPRIFAAGLMARFLRLGGLSQRVLAQKEAIDIRRLK